VSVAAGAGSVLEPLGSAELDMAAGEVPGVGPLPLPPPCCCSALYSFQELRGRERVREVGGVMQCAAGNGQKGNDKS
jgi:hypothetical protein